MPAKISDESFVEPSGHHELRSRDGPYKSALRHERGTANGRWGTGASRTNKRGRNKTWSRSPTKEKHRGSPAIKRHQNWVKQQKLHEGPPSTPLQSRKGTCFRPRSLAPPSLPVVGCKLSLPDENNKSRKSGNRRRSSRLQTNCSRDARDYLLHSLKATMTTTMI